MSGMAIFFLVVITLGLSLLLSFLGWMTIRTNLVGWFLFITGWIYFFGVVIVYWIRKIPFWRSQEKGKTINEEQDDWSFWLIVVSMIAVFYLPPIEYLYFRTVSVSTPAMQIIGLILVFFGSGLFIWARRVLGKYYSGHVSVLEGQPLVQSGPYRFIRHPAYAGYLLIASGITCGYSSLTGLLLIPLLLLPSVIYRLSVEDKLLAEHFGDHFGEYARKTARLIPGVW